MSALLSSLFRTPSRAAVRRLGYGLLIMFGTTAFGWGALGLAIGFGLSAKAMTAILVVMAVPVGIFGASALLLFGLIKAVNFGIDFIDETLSAPEPEQSAVHQSVTTARTTVEAASAPAAAASTSEPTRIVAPTLAPESFGFVLIEKVLEFVRTSGPLTIGVVPAVVAMLFSLHFVATLPVPQFTSSQQRGFEYLGSRPLGGFSPLTPVVNWFGQHPEVMETFLVLLAAAALTGLLYAGYRVAMALYRVVIATAHHLGRFYATASPVVRKAYRTTVVTLRRAYAFTAPKVRLAYRIGMIALRELGDEVAIPAKWLLIELLVVGYRASVWASNATAIEPRFARHRRDARPTLVPEPRSEHAERELVGATAR